jgi:hypothetical protein
MATQTERIRALNDQLRTVGKGGDIVVTSGIDTLDMKTKIAVFAAVQAFDAFTTANDPHGEHDFGQLMVAAERIMFKIDYYDRSLSGHSPDPGDPQVTRRVLTIMLASEY